MPDNLPPAGAPAAPGAEVRSTMNEVSMDLYNSTTGRRSIEDLLADLDHALAD